MSTAARKPLSAQARRAIAIRRAIAARTAPTAANDNAASPRVRGGARMMTTACLAACIEAAGFADHASR